MFDLSIFEETGKASNAYDNQGAYNQLQMMMRNGERLSVKFYTSRQDNTPCAWIESRNVSGFRYIMKDESLKGLLLYLTKGTVTDFDPDPAMFETMDEDFGESIMKKLVESGRTIQWIPLFRERLDRISGNLPCRMGRIYLRAARTQETIEWLREYKQAV